MNPYELDDEPRPSSITLIDDEDIMMERLREEKDWESKLFDFENGEL